MGKLRVISMSAFLVFAGILFSGCAPDQVILLNDKVIPTLTIISPTNGQEVSSVYSISGTSSDDNSGVSKIYIKLDNGAFSLIAAPFANWTTDIALTVYGTHTNYVYAQDAAGNTSLTQSVIVCCTSPVLTITDPVEDLFTYGRQHYTIFGVCSSSCNIQGIFVSTNNTTFYEVSNYIAGSTNWYTSVLLSQGICVTNIIKVFAKDDLGRNSLTNQAKVVSYNKLVASDGTMGDCFGKSVSMSSNGEIIALGAPGDNSGSGTLYIKQWDGTGWNEIKIANYSGMQEFGCTVSVSADGSAIAVGKKGFGYAGYSQLGSALVYRWNGITWAGTSLSGEQESFDNFGNSISTSYNGNTIAVGALNDDICSNTNQGSVYIFKWNGTNYYDYQILTGSDGAADDQFGYSVSISEDGNTVVVGAPCYNNGSVVDQGAIYVYSWNGTNWDETLILASDGLSGDMFGCSVSLDPSGNYLAVGAENANSGKGAVYIFRKSTNWGFQAKVIVSDGINGDEYGCSVSIGFNGKGLLVGAKNCNGGKGAIYFYKFFQFPPTKKYYSFDGVAGDYFGESVIISPNGNFFIAGAGYEDGASINQGSAYMFSY